MNLPASKLIKSQYKEFEVKVANSKLCPSENGRILTIVVRYDDQCNNGHNTFSITGSTPETRSNGGMAGCIHDFIEEQKPEFRDLIKWHLCSSDGPMYYIENTLYHVKEGNIGYAKSCAIWPMAEIDDFTEEKLNKRLPSLMASFKQSIDDIGFIY